MRNPRKKANEEIHLCCVLEKKKLLPLKKLMKFPDGKCVSLLVAQIAGKKLINDQSE
jgi:hypothetical protein